MSFRDPPPHLSTTIPSSSSSQQQQQQRSPPPTFPDTSNMFPEDDPDDPEGNDEAEAIFRDMSWSEIMEDLNARFLLNLPKEELGLIRVYWQAEQAHWFYEDYLRPLNPSLPALSQRQFTTLILESSPIYASEEFRNSLVAGSTDGFGTESGKSLLTRKGEVDYDVVWEEYCSYKRMVPCCGGILINRDGDKCLMVRGWKSNAGWSFPRGKINSEEAEVACAIREVEEETGFDLTDIINPDDYVQTQISAQTVTMFIVGGIDEDTVFETQTRKEIGAIEWVRLVDLPTWTNKRGPRNKQNNKRFYNVTPFVVPLKKWLTAHGFNPNPKSKKKGAVSQSQSQQTSGGNYRNLEPYQFDSPSHSPSLPPPIPEPTPVPHRDPSALDDLFSRFIHKQEEDLQNPSTLHVTGSDDKDGLQRLFGNMDVLKQEEAMGRTTAETEKEEDDALAQLLGGLGTTDVVVSPPSETKKVLEGREGKLLGILNGPGISAVPRLSTSPESVPSPGGISFNTGSPLVKTTPVPIKPHQSHLLSMLSPRSQPASTPAPFSQTSVDPESHQYASSNQLLLPHKPVSLPTSPRPPSPTPSTPLGGLTEEERRNRQRALLEMTLAGIGPDQPHNIRPRAGPVRRISDPETAIDQGQMGRGFPHAQGRGGQPTVPVQSPGTGSPRQPPPPYTAATAGFGSIPRNAYPEQPQHSPPPPPVIIQNQPNDHQRSLLSTLFGAQPNPQTNVRLAPQPGLPGPPGPVGPGPAIHSNPPYRPMPISNQHQPGQTYGPGPVPGPVYGGVGGGQSAYGQNPNVGPMAHQMFPGQYGPPQPQSIGHPYQSHQPQPPMNQYQPPPPGPIPGVYGGYQQQPFQSQGQGPIGQSGYLPPTRPPPVPQNYISHHSLPPVPAGMGPGQHVVGAGGAVGGLPQLQLPGQMPQRSPPKGYPVVANPGGAHNSRGEREMGVHHPVPRPPAGTALGLINQR